MRKNRKERKSWASNPALSRAYISMRCYAGEVHIQMVLEGETDRGFSTWKKGGGVENQWRGLPNEIIFVALVSKAYGGGG